MKKNNILVSGIGKRNALISLLQNEKQRFNINVIGADASTLPPARLAVESFEQLPRADEEIFKGKFINLLREKDVDAYFTLIDPEIPLLGIIEEEFNDIKSRLIHPPTDTSLLCEDKFTFAIELERAGISVFNTSLSPLKEYPFIRKDRRGSAASGLEVYDSPESAPIAETRGEYIYQPFCEGNHYCIDAYFSINNGELIDFCAKQVIEKSKGESFLLKTVSRGDFTALLNQISSVIPLRGIVNFDFLDDNGTIRLLEINCRIGGNYPASHGFGCNLIQHCLDELFHNPNPKTNLSSYKKNQVIAKYFDFSTPVELAELGEC